MKCWIKWKRRKLGARTFTGAAYYKNQKSLYLLHAEKKMYKQHSMREWGAEGVKVKRGLKDIIVWWVK